jgi:nicotinate-nucleotide adenylyltransferase
MRLGLLGGTFDPIHYGHLLLAERCREECGLDRVWFLPAGQPPHKTADGISPGPQRAEMVEFAIAGHPQFQVSRIELTRTGRSFTIDTLRELHAEDPSRELFFLIGADSLADLPDWRDPAGIVDLATIVAVNRGDRPLPDLDGLRRALGSAIADRVRLVTMPGIDLSSTDIRRRFRGGKSIRFMTPRPCEVYIQEHQLYVGRESDAQMTKNEGMTKE